MQTAKISKHPLVHAIAAALVGGSAWAGQVYDFGSQGTFQVESDGSVLQQDANGNWSRLEGVRVENGTVYQNGTRIGALSESADHATLQVGGNTASGSVSHAPPVTQSPANPPSAQPAQSSGPSNVHIDTQTRLHPKVGTYDFGDKGRFVVTPDGHVLRDDGNHRLQDLGLRMDTLGRVLDRNDNVVGRLTQRSGYPVYESSDGQSVLGHRVSDSYGAITTNAGSGVPSGVRVDLGDNMTHEYLSYDFAHPYSGIYQAGDERYSVERQTGRIWRYNPTIHRFQAQPYFVDQSGHIVDERSNRIVGSIQPESNTGRAAIIELNGKRITTEWGAPAAGNFADSIAHKKESFEKFLRPAIERFGNGKPVYGGGVLSSDAVRSPVRSSADPSTSRAAAQASDTETGVGRSVRRDSGITRTFDMGARGRFRVQPNGQVQQQDANGNWVDLDGTVYQNGIVYRNGNRVGQFHAGPHGQGVEYTDLQTGEKSRVDNFEMTYARGRDNPAWLAQKAGVYDFGDQGVFVVDDKGSVFRKEGDRLVPTNNWIGMTAFGASIMDESGHRIGNLNNGGDVAHIAVNGRRKGGRFYAAHDLEPGVQGPRRKSVCDSGYRSYYVSLVSNPDAGGTFSGGCE